MMVKPPYSTVQFFWGYVDGNCLSQLWLSDGTNNTGAQMAMIAQSETSTASTFRLVATNPDLR